MTKYNKELLEYLIMRDNAIVNNIPEKLNRDSKISFICNCSQVHINTFRYILMYNGLHCKNCCKIISDNKRKNTNLEKYGVEYVQQDIIIKEKSKNTILEKYGVDNVFKNKDIRNKSKRTMLLKYGVEYSIQKKEIQNIVKIKSRKTHLEKYGVEYSIQNKEIYEKRKKSNLIKYGVENVLQYKQIQEKIQNTNLNRYGVKCNFQRKEIQEKIKQININKYGVEYPMQNIDVQNKSQKNSKRFKEYVMPSGIVRKVQGYEPFALNILTKTYTEEQIKTNRKDVPRIKYTVNEKNKYYFPDIYIPDENRIIEVKSDWTCKINTEIINLKKEACIAQGYDYEIWCFNSKGEKLI